MKMTVLHVALGLIVSRHGVAMNFVSMQMTRKHAMTVALSFSNVAPDVIFAKNSFVIFKRTM